MFRARFTDAFSSKLMNFGPQDIERGVVDSVPSAEVESLLCALLGLVLNRKKPIECVLRNHGINANKSDMGTTVALSKRPFQRIVHHGRLSGPRILSLKTKVSTP